VRGRSASGRDEFDALKEAQLVYPKAGKVYAADTDRLITEKIKKEFPNVAIVHPTEIHKQKVDIFAPCALSGALNSKTIAELKCRIVASGANNQLQDDAIGDLLFKLNILYARFTSSPQV
jgi:leucine dehydrogenase